MSDQGWTAPGGAAPRPEPSPPATSPEPPAPQQPWAQQPPPPPQQPAWQAPPTYAPQMPYPGQPGMPPAPRLQGPPVRLDFRPGIIPLRPLKLDDIFGAVFRAVRGNVGATVGLGALTSLIFIVPFTALGAWISSQEESVSFEDSITSETAGIAGSIGSTLPAVGQWLSSILLAGFLAYVIGQAVLGRKVSASETWSAVRPRIWRLLGATLLTVSIYLGTLAVVLGLPITLLITGAMAGNDGSVAAGFGLLMVALLLLVVAELFLWTRLAFVTPAVVLEGLGVRAAFGRSWRLTGGTPFWRLLGLRLLTAIAIGIAGSLITLPLQFLAGGLLFVGIPLDQIYVWQAVIAGVSGVIGGAITTPITAGVDALLFVDQRIRREALDIHLIQSVQGITAPPWASAAR